MTIPPTALAVVGHQTSNRAVTETSHLPQPQQEGICLALGLDRLPVALQQPIGMDGSCLTLLLCPDPKYLQQTHLLALHKRLVRDQGAIKGPLLVVAPDLGTDRLCPGNCNRITPATQAVDKRIPSINPHPHLEASVVVPQRGRLLHGKSASDAWLEPPPTPSQGSRVHP